MEAQEVFGLDFDPAEFEQLSDTSEDYEDDDDEVLLIYILLMFSRNICLCLN